LFPTDTTFGGEINKDPLVYHWSYLLGPWSLVMLAWGIIFIAFATKQTDLLDHDFLLRTSHFPWWLALVLFLVAWQLMIVAMMLPSTLSVLVALAAMDRTSRPIWAIQGAFIVAYAGVWTLFAFAAFVGDTLIHFTANHWEWFSLHSRWIGTALCFVAAAHQWGTLKQQCLYQGRGRLYHCMYQSQSPWLLGWRYGLSCVGSCWTVMLVMFGIGMNNLLSIALLTGVVVVEKEIPAGRRLKPIIGIAFLLLGVLWIMYS
jgi:predicted metal-binding membrane protein